MKAEKPEIRLRYERVGSEKGHSRPHRHKKRRPAVRPRDHRIRSKKDKDGLAALWPGKAGTGLKIAFKAADALGINGQNSKYLRRAMALGQVVTDLFSSSSVKSDGPEGKKGSRSSRRIYEKRPARRKRAIRPPVKDVPTSSSSSASASSASGSSAVRKSSSSQASRRKRSSGKLTRAKWNVITRGDNIFPKYQKAYIDSSNNEHMEYMIDSEARREYGIQKKYVRSTVFDYLDKVERGILEKKMDKIDDAILEMSDSAFEKSKIEWKLKYAHLAAVAIQLAVEALLQECPGHFLGSEAKKVITKPTEWHCEYDKDVRGRRKRPLEAIADLTYRETTNRTSVSGALTLYEWYFSRSDNKRHQLRYVKSSWQWYQSLTLRLREMLSSSGPVYEELSNISDKYQLSKIEKKLFNKTVKVIWNTWTWARFLVTEHWRYIEFGDKSATVYDERIEMLGELSVLSDKEYKRAKKRYRDKPAESKLF